MGVRTAVTISSHAPLARSAARTISVAVDGTGRFVVDPAQFLPHLAFGEHPGLHLGLEVLGALAGEVLGALDGFLIGLQGGEPGLVEGFRLFLPGGGDVGAGLDLDLPALFGQHGQLGFGAFDLLVQLQPVQGGGLKFPSPCLFRLVGGQPRPERRLLVGQPGFLDLGPAAGELFQVRRLGGQVLPFLPAAFLAGQTDQRLRPVGLAPRLPGVEAGELRRLDGGQLLAGVLGIGHLAVQASFKQRFRLFQIGRVVGKIDEVLADLGLANGLPDLLYVLLGFLWQVRQPAVIELSLAQIVGGHSLGNVTVLLEQIGQIANTTLNVLICAGGIDAISLGGRRHKLHDAQGAGAGGEHPAGFVVLGQARLGLGNGACQCIGDAVLLGGGPKLGFNCSGSDSFGNCQFQCLHRADLDRERPGLPGAQHLGGIQPAQTIGRLGFPQFEAGGRIA
jgi:hypothetical protein